MAQLDRFLSVMVANGADSINLTEHEVATLRKDGAPRPITKQPLTAEQLAAGTSANFRYSNTEGHFAVVASHAGGKWQASIGFGEPGAEVVATADAGVAASEAVTATAPQSRASNGAAKVAPIPTANGSANGSANGAGTASGAANGSRHSGRTAMIDEPVARPPAQRQDTRPAAAQSTEERAASALAAMDGLLRVLVEKKASDLHL